MAPYAPLAARHYFGVRAATQAARLAAEEREGLARVLRLLRQKRAAAQTLLEADAPAEALRLAHEAAGAARALLGRAGGAPEQALARWGFRDAEAVALMGSLDGPQHPAPATDDLVAQADVERCERQLDACLALERAFAWAELAPRAALRTRVRRAAAVASLLVPCAWGVAVALEPWAVASASETRHPERAYAPSNVLDGLAATEWALPEGRRGWVELRLARPRTVSVIRLRNAGRHEDGDHGTQDYVVELYAGEDLVATRQGTLVSTASEAPWVEVNITGHAIDRIRVVARSCWGPGAGLADIEVP